MFRQRESIRRLKLPFGCLALLMWMRNMSVYRSLAFSFPPENPLLIPLASATFMLPTQKAICLKLEARTKRSSQLRLIGKRRTTHFVVFNRGKQGTTVHTVMRLPIFRYAKTVQTACWGPPQSPGKGHFRCHAERWKPVSGVQVKGYSIEPLGSAPAQARSVRVWEALFFRFHSQFFTPRHPSHR